MIAEKKSKEFLILEKQISKTIKPIVSEKYWDKTTTDSTLFIAKTKLNRDHIKNEKNNNEDLFKKYFFKSIFKKRKTAKTIVFKMFKYSHWVTTLSIASKFGINPTIR